MSNDLVLLAGRILLSAVFIISGVSKFGGMEGLAGYIGSVGLPVPMLLAWLAAIFETLAGIAVLIGFRTGLAALLLAAFCVFTALVFHYQPGDEMQMIVFMKNITIAGGFLALLVAGPGAFSIDGRRTAAA